MSAVSQSTLTRDLGLVGWQIRYEQRAYWRNRGRGVFTFVFPVMLLAIFASLDKGQHIASRGGISYNDFFIPGILAYGVITTTFMNLAIGTAILRDQGVLKRMQGTPLPRWAYVGAGIASASLISFVMAMLVLVLGSLVWGLDFRVGEIPGIVATLLLGTACFTTLGIGITRFMPNAESSPVLVNLVTWPLTFISNIWFPTDSLPTFLKDLASVFPIKALAGGLQYVFDPRHHGVPINGSDLRTLAIWTVIGIYLMVRFLHQPQGEVT
ncbi:MAG: ABC transporter permease [Solirubrobacteraceae bacterium]